MQVLYLRNKYVLVWALVGAVLVAAICGTVHWAGGFRYVFSAAAANVRLTPVYAVNRDDGQVSISFDATWGAERTEEILDILDEYNVKATFFLVNIWMKEYPEMTREIARRGHEIGLQSVSHPNFPTLTQQQVDMELRENADLIKSLTGQQPVLFRFPFGDYDNASIEQAESLGFQPVQWSVDSLDWKDLPADEIVQRVMSRVQSGDIILCHNNGLNTPAATREILSQLQQQGLQAVPISQLLLPKESSYIDYNGIQQPSPGGTAAVSEKEAADKGEAAEPDSPAAGATVPRDAAQ